MRTILLCIFLEILTLASAARPTIYLIRHGEKPKDGGNGLSAEGLKRAQCLRQVFGADSEYNIGFIMTQKPKLSMK